MNIIGPDRVVFGVDDLAACIRFLTDFGLAPVGVDATGGVFEALDGTAIEVRAKADPRLPAPLPTSTMLRQQVYGVKAPADLDAIEAELARDQRVTRLADGSLEAADGDGFALRFQVTTRRTLSMPAEKINAPGAPAQRAPNELGVYAGMPARPRTLSHVVLFVPDQKRAARWYCDRLKFVITDVLEPAGPFLRPQGTDDHHTLFFIQTPEYMQG
ncbi:MAG: glyoxalase, partial [Rhodobacteraceae bacterium]|nr:glyoxalase [Paracoccaceae bacterium]